MKLVELLARELNEWPEGAEHSVQDYDGCFKFGAGNDPGGDGEGTWIRDIEVEHELHNGFHSSEKSSDWNTSIVTRAQWQAERDRQKGGEWKRHRGGKQPVADGVRVEIKQRNSVTDTNIAEGFIWKHHNGYYDIMQYRIISQPQAEEVEVSKPELTYKLDWVEIDDRNPLKWRDTILHCQAIIEDCEREIERNVERLADEGFALIQPITDVRASDPEVDPGDWRNWAVGDELECVFSTCSNIYTVGVSYTVKKIEDGYAVVTDDTLAGNGTCHVGDEDTIDIRFIRRP